MNIILHGVSLELIGFGISTYSTADGNDGQDILNNQFNDNLDIYVGILWKKFGTPTQRAGSGTLEEFHRAYSRFKEKKMLMKIAFYFNTKISNLNEVDTYELAKINEFKKKFQTNEYAVLYQEYNTYRHFERLFRCNISIFIYQLSQTRKALEKFSQIEEHVQRELTEFKTNGKQIDDLNVELSQAWDKIYGSLNIQTNLNEKMLNVILIKITNGADILRKLVEKFDAIMKKLFSNIANLIIYFNYLNNSELTSEIFITFKREFVILLGKYQFYMDEFNKHYFTFDKIDGNNRLLRTFKEKYTIVIKGLINNFSSYTIIIQTYLDFIEKILNLDIDLSKNE